MQLHSVFIYSAFFCSSIPTIINRKYYEFENIYRKYMSNNNSNLKYI